MEKEEKKIGEKKRSLNPIAYFKHLAKDPVTTMDEEKAREREILPWLIGNFAAALVFCALAQFVFEGFLAGLMTALYTICFLLAMFFGFLFLVVRRAKDKFKALTCKSCNTMATIKNYEEYKKYVSYGLTQREPHYDSSNLKSNNGVVDEIKVSAYVPYYAEVNLTCQNCGTVKPLIYSIKPFKCSISQKKVPARDALLVKATLENKIKETVTEYIAEYIAEYIDSSLEKRKIPYTIHGRKSLENGKKMKVYNPPKYEETGVTINYHRNPYEMVEQFFMENKLDGHIYDPSEPQKKKKFDFLKLFGIDD